MPPVAYNRRICRFICNPWQSTSNPHNRWDVELHGLDEDTLSLLFLYTRVQKLLYMYILLYRDITHSQVLLYTVSAMTHAGRGGGDVINSHLN